MQICVYEVDLSPSLQLTGWTSNLVDIIMAHHFSTVSFSFGFFPLFSSMSEVQTDGL